VGGAAWPLLHGGIVAQSYYGAWRARDIETCRSLTPSGPINPIFIGVPGSGKTFLARALAYKACQATKRVVVVPAPKMLYELHAAEMHGALDRVARRYARANLLVIDDFAVLTMDGAQAKLAFQVIGERYDYRRSTAITTNCLFKDWTHVFPDTLNAQIIAERLTERAEHFVLEKSFRTPR
jgi:DNA replication protein DnaC